MDYEALCKEIEKAFDVVRSTNTKAGYAGLSNSAIPRLIKAVRELAGPTIVDTRAEPEPELTTGSQDNEEVSLDEE